MFKDLCSALSCVFLSWTNESSSSVVVIGPLCIFLQADMQFKILLLCVKLYRIFFINININQSLLCLCKRLFFSFNSLAFYLFALVLHLYALSIKSPEYFIIRLSEAFPKPCGPVFFKTRS